MAKNLTQQFSKLLFGSSHILILLPENPSCDSLSSGMGLTHFCNQKNIATTMAFIDPQENKKALSFLKDAPDTKLTHSIS